MMGAISNFYLLVFTLFAFQYCLAQDSRTISSNSLTSAEESDDAPSLLKPSRLPDSETPEATDLIEMTVPPMGDDTGGGQTLNDTVRMTTPQNISGKFTTDALMRGFYVFIGIGVIVLTYIGVKTCRLRRHRAMNRYKVISRGEDAESLFPSHVDEEEDEEIFNASNRQTYS